MQIMKEKINQPINQLFFCTAVRNSDLNNVQGVQTRFCIRKKSVIVIVVCNCVRQEKLVNRLMSARDKSNLGLLDSGPTNNNNIREGPVAAKVYTYAVKSPLATMARRKFALKSTLPVDGFPNPTTCLIPGLVRLLES